MQTERSLELRQQKSPDLKWLEYPYFYLNEYDLTPRQIIGEPKQNSIDFPSCISHYYWIHEGINDEVPWRALKNKIQDINFVSLSDILCPLYWGGINNNTYNSVLDICKKNKKAFAFHYGMSSNEI
jgi:hypothetical protein